MSKSKYALDFLNNLKREAAVKEPKLPPAASTENENPMEKLSTEVQQQVLRDLWGIYDTFEAATDIITCPHTTASHLITWYEERHRKDDTLLLPEDDDNVRDEKVLETALARLQKEHDELKKMITPATKRRAILKDADVPDVPQLPTTVSPLLDKTLTRQRVLIQESTRGLRGRKREHEDDSDVQEIPSPTPKRGKGATGSAKKATATAKKATTGSGKGSGKKSDREKYKDQGLDITSDDGN